MGGLAVFEFPRSVTQEGPGVPGGAGKGLSCFLLSRGHCPGVWSRLQRLSPHCPPAQHSASGAAGDRATARGIPWRVFKGCPTEGQYLSSSWAGAVRHCLWPLAFRPLHPYLRNALIDMRTTPGTGSGVPHPHPHSQAETGGPAGERVCSLLWPGCGVP